MISRFELWTENSAPISDLFVAVSQWGGAVAYGVLNGHFLTIPHRPFALSSLQGEVLRKAMRALKGVLPVAEVVGLILAVTGILWQLELTIGASQGLIYIYLFPVTLIAALYNGRLALLGASIALVCADYFLQAPLYSLVNDNPREYGDLFVFAVLAATAIKFVRVLVRSRVSLAHKSPSAAE